MLISFESGTGLTKSSVLLRVPMFEVKEQIIWLDYLAAVQTMKFEINTRFINC